MKHLSQEQGICFHWLFKVLTNLAEVSVRPITVMMVDRMLDVYVVHCQFSTPSEECIVVLMNDNHRKNFFSCFRRLNF